MLIYFLRRKFLVSLPFDKEFSMKKSIFILFVGTVCMLIPQRSQAKEEKIELPDRVIVNDTILYNIFKYARLYSRVIDEYDADLYLKAHLLTHKYNHLIRYVPSMFRFEKGVKEYIGESLSEIHYTAPNIYDRKVKAFISTFPRNRGQIADIYDFINLNIYSATLMTNKILSPLDKDNSKYYTYLLDSICGSLDSVQYKILIIPKFRSTQLVSGYMWVSDQIWSIRSLYFEGIYDVIHFKIKVDMGTKDNEEFVPVHYDMNLRFKFVGNDLEMRGDAWMKYKNIKLYSKYDEIRKRRNKHHHDKTDSYTLSCDTAHLITDEKHFSLHRPYPLKSDEDMLYARWHLRNGESVFKSMKKENKANEFWGQLGDALINSYYVNLSGIGSVKCSPLINPVMLDYSHSRGFSYRQKFKYNRFFTNTQRLIRIVPQFGYNFKSKELYVKLDTEYQYWPEKQGELELHIGNGNRIYSSMILDQLKQFPEGTFNLKKNDLDYFRDINFTLFNSIEVVNGLTVKTGVSIHWRHLINKSNVELQHPVSAKEWAKIREIDYSYNSCAPRVQLQWTPSLYYYMNGKRKMNIGSDLPTFMLDYERGVKGIFGCNGEYERWEFDLQQNMKLGGIRSLGYRIGGGIFTKHQGMYFIDFQNFRRHNIPEDWNDEIGGTFQLLESKWFNSSRKYIRAHATYESPFILLKPFNKWLSRIQQERLYIGLLSMPQMHAYAEFGYGIGTHIFDVGAFLNNISGKFKTFGLKFTFELFND